jgi:hypothetical protein
MRDGVLVWGLLVAASVPATARGAGDETTAELLYERAVEAAQAGRNEAAAALFDEATAAMGAAHPLRALAIYGAARANQRLETPETACKAAERFRVFIGLPEAEPEKREKAANALGGLTTRCATRDVALAAAVTPASAPPSTSTVETAPAEGAPGTVAAGAPVHPAPAPAADDTWAWAATGAASASAVVGAVLLIMAGGALDDSEAALDRFEAGGRTSTADRDAVYAADDRATTYGLAGYGLLGLGAALGGVATWLWLREPEAGVVLSPAPGGLGVVGRF